MITPRGGGREAEKGIVEDEPRVIKIQNSQAIEGARQLIEDLRSCNA